MLNNAVRSNSSASSRARINRLIIFFAAAAIILAGIIRYIAQPSFWLDEAFIASSLLEPSRQSIFGPLEYGQFFPRIYLASIAALRETFGYHIWDLRLLPTLSFIVATVMWARLLAQRSREYLTVALLAAASFIGSMLWLDQAIQLKQYTFDVMLALVPFVVGDEFFKQSLVEGKRKWLLILLALPCALSYTYPIALGARAAGWYINQARRAGGRVNSKAVFIFAATLALALLSLWWTDHRFNLQDSEAYFAYWKDCILRSAFNEGWGATLRLIAKFLWGWHGRQPFVTASIAPLQIAGVYSVIKRCKKRDVGTGDLRWGSRSLGSIVLIAGVMLASAVANYPICAGRVVLFAQIHLQILAIEGALFILSFSKSRNLVLISLWLASAVVLFHSAREYVNFIRSEPAENLRPILSLIDPNVTNTAWVHPCSIAQVKTLPGGLPVEQVAFGSEKRFPQRGQKTWIIWTHLGNEECVRQLDEVRSRARSWQVIHEGTGRGLALAEF
ncbi:MAG TPA: hypothetical protein VNN73_16270 [Blastocatellia bacterium]|nr:hypothetical protein [Blastocatellia bacterium]